MKNKSAKKKSADLLDDVFLDALKDDIPEELSAEEVLSEEQLENLEEYLEDGEPEIERFAGAKPKKETDDGLKVKISEDGMTASLLAHNCPPTTLEKIKEELQNNSVAFGIKEKALANAVTSINTGGGWKGELVIANGTLPALDDLITFDFLTKEKDPVEEKFVWMAGDVPLFFDEIKELLKSKDLDEINKSDLQVKGVNPYQVIATLKEDVKSMQGYNIYGQPVGDLLKAPEAGVNVEFDEEDGTYTAESFGYFHMDNRKISVLSPAWTTQDQMTMFFINFKQAGEFCFPYPENIQKMLIDEEVESFAVLISNIEKMSAAFAEGKELPRTIEIAQGIDPIPGKDAYFEFFLDTEIRAGTLRDDDSIDLRERNLVTSVHKDTLLGEKVKSTRGVSGKSVFGNEVKAQDGVDRTIYTNEGVIDKRKDDDTIEYYSAIDGNVSYKTDYITVSDVFGVDGDVDYATGNINVKTGISIGGSVLPGFSVRAGGNSIIEGAVELGANIFINGDLCIKKGVIGEETKVVVIGNLEVEFIQDAEVVVKGDILVRSYIYNATVRASGDVRIPKEAGSKGGKIIGGFVCASKGIELSTVGSETNRSTIVSIQPDPVILGKRKKLAEDIDYCDQNITKMLRTLQLKTFDTTAIKAMLEDLPDDKKEMVVKIITTLNKFIKHRAETIEKRKQLKVYIEQCLKRSKIRVSAEFYEGNKVEIGESNFIAQDDMGPSIFQLQEDRIVY